jgi:hypothetical protein
MRQYRKDGLPADSDEDAFYPNRQPKYYGHEDINVEDTIDFVSDLGKACCISALQLVDVLDLPKKGRTKLALLKYFILDRYYRHLFLLFFCFTHCLRYMNLQLRKIFNLSMSPQAVSGVASMAYSSAAVFYSKELGLTKEESDILKKELTQRYAEYNNEADISADVLLDNIIKGTGLKLSDIQTLTFIYIGMDTLRCVEVDYFIRRYREIAGNW